MAKTKTKTKSKDKRSDSKGVKRTTSTKKKSNNTASKKATKKKKKKSKHQDDSDGPSDWSRSSYEWSSESDRDTDDSEDRGRRSKTNKKKVTSKHGSKLGKSHNSSSKLNRSYGSLTRSSTDSNLNGRRRSRSRSQKIYAEISDAETLSEDDRPRAKTKKKKKPLPRRRNSMSSVQGKNGISRRNSPSSAPDNFSKDSGEVSEGSLDLEDVFGGVSKSDFRHDSKRSKKSRHDSHQSSKSRHDSKLSKSRHDSKRSLSRSRHDSKESLHDSKKSVRRPPRPKKKTARERKRELEEQYASTSEENNSPSPGKSGSNIPMTKKKKRDGDSSGDLKSAKRPSLKRRGSVASMRSTADGNRSISPMVRMANSMSFFGRSTNTFGDLGTTSGHSSRINTSTHTQGTSKSERPPMRGKRRGSNATMSKSGTFGHSQRGRAMERQASGRSMRNFRTGGMKRANTTRSMGNRSKSMDKLRAQNSVMQMSISTTNGRMNKSFNGSFNFEDEDLEQAKPMSKKKKSLKDFERPPKTLVFIWLVVAAELGFDLGTTVIAFRSLAEEDDCCGRPILVGPVPFAINIPFFFLVAAELSLLIRAILLTTIPGLLEFSVLDTEYAANRSCIVRWFCCCLRWKVQVIMHIIGILVLLNPFFGCVIAWILLYQSDKREAFLVLGFEGAALLLHYISVYLEGSIKGFVSFMLHIIIPILPFATGVGLILFYLKQGGVCYLADDQNFFFNGCEVCLNGFPPVDGVCTLLNGTVSYKFKPTRLLNLPDFNPESDSLAETDKLLADLTDRTPQNSYCAAENPGGPMVDFCFFDFEEGKLNGTAVSEFNVTEINSFNNSCGATASIGARDEQCEDDVWDATRDDTIHCIAFGGPDDPCQLSATEDNVNGLEKDPSLCVLDFDEDTIQIPTYGDTFFLWSESEDIPDFYTWAGDLWIQYSTDRFPTEIAELKGREQQRVLVTSPLVTLGDSGTLQTNFQTFFDACGPSCDDPSSTAYIDVLAVNVFCDNPTEESCRDVAEAAMNEITATSAAFGNRTVYITSWGVRTSEEPPNLLNAMGSTDVFFTNPNTPVQRVYWYGGNRAVSNLKFPADASGTKSLGDVWVETCAPLN